MNGTVVEMSGATIELDWSDETDYDEHGSRWLSIRVHNEKGEHCLLKLRDPALLILDDREMTLPFLAEESAGDVRSEAGHKAATVMGMAMEPGQNRAQTILAKAVIP